MKRIRVAILLISAAFLACSRTDSWLTEEPSPTPQPTATHTPSPTTTPSPSPIPSATPLDIEGEIAIVSDRDGSYQVYLMNADGSDVRQPTYGPGENTKPAWSPDGAYVAFTSARDGDREIYIMWNDGSDQVNFSDHPGDDHSPAWSPDGSAIAFVANIEGFDQLTVLSLDGSLRAGLRGGVAYPQASVCCVSSYSNTGVTSIGIEDGVGSITSDELTSQSLFIQRDVDRGGFSECCVAYSPTDDSFLQISSKSGVEQIYWEGGPEGGSVQLTYHAQGSHGPSRSLDGEWIAYYAEQDGAFDVFLMRPTAPEPPNLTSHPANDLEPAWRPSP
ncbi:MAG TPA: hypothetical protein VJK02_03760 [Anaerolineales bacterium]|nr:hypothetical protein [Anaerolineales bacterium]